MKKMFRAASETIVEALLIPDRDPDQPGWFHTREEAFANYKPPVAPVKATVATVEETDTMATHDAPKRRGRPRNADTVI